MLSEGRLIGKNLIDKCKNISIGCSDKDVGFVVMPVYYHRIQVLGELCQLVRDFD